MTDIVRIVNDADGCPAILINGTKVAELTHDQEVSITCPNTTSSAPVAGPVIASATPGDGDTAAAKPPGAWNVAEIKQGVTETWVRLAETQYVADEPWPKVGQVLVERR